MKKKLFIFAVAGLALASCSSDETTASLATSGANEINFRPLMTGVTRAAIDPGVMTAWGASNQFNVYAEYGGSKYFQADFATNAGHDANFAPTVGQYYWPSLVDGDHKVTFTAIYGIASPATDAPGKFTSFSPVALPENQVDVLVAKKECSTKESPVSMVFSHALSKISVRAKNTDPNLKFEISKVRIGGIKNVGEFNYNYNYSTPASSAGATTAASTYIPATNWNISGSATKFSKDLSTITVAGSNEGTNILVSTPWLLLPQNVSPISAYANTQLGGSHAVSTEPDFDSGAYIALYMTVKNNATDAAIVTNEWCYWPISVSWTPGYGYTYLINLAGGGYFPTDQDNDEASLDPILGNPIVFDVTCTIDSWNDQSATNVGM